MPAANPEGELTGASALARTRTLFLPLSLAATLALGVPALAPAASPAPVGADNGMVVSAQHLATRVGVDVLKQGGNAVDAAVAVGYALAVVYPAAGNLGGGGFMTLRLADGRSHFLDFREQAPQAATAAMFLGADGQVLPGLSTRSHLAVGVPGSVHGLEAARAQWGTMTRAALIAPAIRHAEQGFRLEQADVDLLRVATDDFRRDPASAAIFLRPDGQPYQAGDTLVQKDLARTLTRIRDLGAAGFYQGPVGAAIVASSQAGSLLDGQRVKGLITQADLDGYRSRPREPVACDYRGLRIVSAPPPSSGGVVLCQMLRVLEGYPLADWGWRSDRAVHVQIEAMRHAYLDRNTRLGDPDFVPNPLAQLLGDGHVAAIRAAIDSGRAGNSQTLRPGVPPHALHEGQNTTHYSIIDRWGNAASVTTTLNDWFGARLTVAGTGVLLNNEMDDFTAKPGVPNLYGLVQGTANAIAPGKRPLSSMSPTVVSRDGQPLMVLGTPGGSRIISAVLHTLLNVVDYGMTVQEAVDAPRFHQQWLPETTSLERFALSPDTQALLQARGHRFVAAPASNHLAAILVGAPALGAAPVAGQRYFGANDPRRGSGLAAGY